MFSLLTCSKAPKRAGDSWNSVFEIIAQRIRSATTRTSLDAGVSERDLHKQVLLHLPRFSWDELIEPQRIPREAERLAEVLLQDRKGFESWAGRPKVWVLNKAEVTVRPCDPGIAREIHERFHYIRSYHPGTVHLGLYFRNDPEAPAALASFSDMDIKHLDWLFPSASDRATAMVLTRLFAFDWAPPNSISYLLGQARKWMKTNLPQIVTLLTYMNPNLGFTGSSFLAANWRPVLEKRLTYSYLHDSYITQRRLNSLPASALRYVTHSVYDLEALKILRYEMNGESGRFLEGASNG